MYPTVSCSNNKPDQPIPMINPVRGDPKGRNFLEDPSTVGGGSEFFFLPIEKAIVPTFPKSSGSPGTSVWRSGTSGLS